MKVRKLPTSLAITKFLWNTQSLLKTEMISSSQFLQKSPATIDS